jgi:hypothetical protein
VSLQEESRSQSSRRDILKCSKSLADRQENKDSDQPGSFFKFVIGAGSICKRLGGVVRIVDPQVATSRKMLYFCLDL